MSRLGCDSEGFSFSYNKAIKARRSAVKAMNLSHFIPQTTRLLLTRLLLLCLAGLLISGCLFKKDEDESLSGAQQLYERAQKSLNGGDFTSAIVYYETLEARFPFSNQARQGQLDLIYAYYRNQQSESVIDATEQFERENPTHPRVDYAIYMRGMALFAGERGYFHKLFRVDISKRPPKDARDSYSAFAELLRRFPNSIYAADARQRMLFLRNRVAEHENHIARYYMERGACAAALNRAAYTVQTYDGSPAIAETMQIMAECYRQLELYDLARDAEQVLMASFPGVEPIKPVDQPDEPWYRFW